MSKKLSKRSPKISSQTETLIYGILIVGIVIVVGWFAISGNRDARKIGEEEEFVRM